MRRLIKAILVLFLAMGAAVAASLLLDIPGGKRFKRYCSYPDMKAPRTRPCRRHAETVRRLKAMVMPELFFYAPATMKDFVECMNQATKDFDDPAVPLEKRGIKFVCKDSVAAKTGPEKPKPDAPLIPCPGVGATTAWDALTNVCNSVGCKFVVSQGKVELGE